MHPAPPASARSATSTFWIRMRLRLAAFLLLALPLSAPAQEAAPLSPGTRVRLSLERQSQPKGLAPSPALQGALTAVGPDSVTLRLHPGATPVSVAVHAIRRIEVSRGVPSRLESALRQAVLLGALGAVEFPLLDRNERSFGSTGEAALAGAAIGAAAGAISGALFPRERWRRVRLPEAAAAQ